MPSLNLIQLNVEGDKHWDRVIPFLERESPEVLCLQEVFDRDAAMVAEKFGYHYLFLPITKKAYDFDGSGALLGTGCALFSKLPITNGQDAYYYKSGDGLQVFKGATMEDKRSTIDQGIVWGVIEKDGAPFTFASTHFTWTPDGKPNKNQDEDLASLLKTLDGIPDVVLCGDFNAPRGADNHIYQALAARYKDNIPADIKTTMDVSLHRVKNDPVERAKLITFVVDYIFSTPAYTVSDVRCEFGVSDHCAVIATVSRAGTATSA